MASLFATLRTAVQRAGYPARSRKAREWFIEKVRALNGRISRKALLNDEALKLRTESSILWGTMLMFVYDPKLKEVLPYYDRFPLVLALQPAQGGFLGLNLHYLHPNIRAAFLDKLMETMPGQNNLTERSRLRMRYALLASAKRYRMFAPCLKHYLSEHVVSRISQVYAPDWEIAIFLPTESFVKATKTQVWRDSQKALLSH